MLLSQLIGEKTSRLRDKLKREINKRRVAMGKEPKVERGDYGYKKEKALNEVASTLEACLKHFYGEEQNLIREDIANYVIGYLGVS